MTKISACSALAATLGMEFKELVEYRYQFEKTKKPLYVIGDDYFTTSQTEPKPVDFGGVEYGWKLHDDQFFAMQASTKIWTAKSKER